MNYWLYPVRAAVFKGTLTGSGSQERIQQQIQPGRLNAFPHFLPEDVLDVKQAYVNICRLYEEEMSCWVIFRGSVVAPYHVNVPGGAETKAAVLMKAFKTNTMFPQRMISEVWRLRSFVSKYFLH